MVPPKVADFEKRYDGDLASMKLFRCYIVSGTRNQAGYAEECASHRFSDVGMSSDKSFALLILKTTRSFWRLHSFWRILV
jgi:hypothetical protein